MARIAGVNIPTNKRVLISLRYIFGIGPKNAKDICDKLGIPDERRVNQLTDEEILKIRERLNEILAKHTGQPLDKIAQDTERDYFMSGEEAKRYGLIDEVITRPPKSLKDLSKDGGKDKG